MSDNMFAIPEPEAWEGDALCAETDPAIFFPKQGGSTAEAKRICSLCAVQDECYARAMSFGNEDQDGIWAGLTRRDRRKLRKAVA